MRIVQNLEWGQRPWAAALTPVSLLERRYFFVHYDGASPCGNVVGNAAPQAVDRGHRARGWAGIGYNYLIDQQGTTFCGRGLYFQGAHCPDYNRTGFGVQLHIGGDERPSQAALTSLRELYETLCTITKRELIVKGHRDGYSTLCPGEWVYANVVKKWKVGNTVPSNDTVANAVWGAQVKAPNWSKENPVYASAGDVLWHAAVHASRASDNSEEILRRLTALESK